MPSSIFLIQTEVSMKYGNTDYLMKIKRLSQEEITITKAALVEHADHTAGLQGKLNTD